MGAGSARYGVAVLILVVLWIAVYWWTPAEAPTPVVSFGDTTTRTPALRLQPDAVETFVPPQVAPAAVATEPIQTPTPAGAGAAPAAASPVTPPSFRDYTIRPGDTADAISRRFFGTPAYWQQVMKANPRVDFMRLRAGRVIRVPVDPDNIQGVPADQVEEPASASPAPLVEYRVKSGDTLSAIAQELYGRAAMWTIIRDANRAKVGDDGTRLRPGMTLTIPPAPSGARR